MKVTTVLENSTVRHNLLSQHGQSLLIELEGKKVLFDVGEIFEGFIYNLERLNVNIDDVSFIVISHRHIDHIGSLQKLLPTLRDQQLFLPTQIGTPDLKKPGPKYIFIDEKENDEYNVAINAQNSETLLAYPHSQIVDKPSEILPNLWTTGCVGVNMQEQALVYDQKQLGLTILVGCSHPGLAAFVDKAREITGNNKIRGLIGGFHFNPMTDEEVLQQAKYLESLNVEYVLPNHCTGVKQTEILRQSLPDKIKISKTYSVGTGNSVVIADEISFDFA